MHLRFIAQLNTISACLVTLVSVLACTSSDPPANNIAEAGGADGANADSANRSAGATTTPDYELAFPQDRVRRLDITISADNWQTMVADLTAMVGAFGAGASMRGPAGAADGGAMPGMPDGGLPPPMPDGGGAFGPLPSGMAFGPLPEGGAFSPPLDGGEGAPTGRGAGAGIPGGMGLGSVDMIPNTPVYVECDVATEGTELHHVGIRFKGNSSLQMPWAQGVWKLPFRLSFDHFEDQYAETKNQRFFGFEDLSLSNGQSDSSLLRDKLGTEVFDRAGLPVPATAFYRIYIDHGAGPAYFGLYTATELPQDNSFLNRRFGDHSGNLYKPDGVGARWQSWDAASLEKENHEEEADYSDARALFDALHGDRSNPEAWRLALESQFNVNGFLHWLALNAVVEDWDSYGQMPHNYYLYASPAESKRFEWIPWDHSYAFSANRSLSLSMGEVTEEWPLIRFLLDDPTYTATYRAFLAQATTAEYSPEWAESRFRAAHDLIAPFVVGPEGEQAGYTFINSPEAFASSVTELTHHVNARASAVSAFLNP